MKKCLLFIRNISIVLVISCFLWGTTSCRVHTTYDFLNTEEEISKVEIVKLGEFDRDSTEYEETVLAVVEDIDAFLNDFSELNCYVYFGDPLGVDTDEIVIKFIYTNNEYELVNFMGQAKYDSEKKFTNYAGYRVFDEEPFNEFISKYIQRTE